MGRNILRSTRPAVKGRPRRLRHFNKYLNPDPAVIPDLWSELCSLASLVPSGEAAGVHRLRTKLLDGVPSWKLPETLDALTTPAGVYA